nr:N-acetylmuramoyl-L-alanine amidase [Alteromonas sp. a30]
MLAQAANMVDSIRVWPSPANTRVVIDLKQTPKFTYFSLSNPQRLVIDLADTKNRYQLSKLSHDSNLLRKVRTSQAKSKGDLRFVLDLTKAVKAQVFALPPTAPYGNRLVIDLTDLERSNTVVKDQLSAKRNRDIVIAIDAGHGGEDPGSIGRAGSYEKNVTLSISKMLANLVNNEPGMSAVLTRSGDYYVGLSRRPERARKSKSDLLVSIHADAFTTPQPSGASVWVLSMNRANTELGRWMEKSERHSELLGGAAEIIQDTANERYLTQALLDMSMDHSLTTSYQVSRGILKELRQVTKLHKKRPQAASLAVLTSPDIPSVLVETGFISNPREEKNLNWSKYRKRLAKAIFRGIKKHFQETPPDGTLWASWRSQNRTHRVQSGESLSLLAKRYNVSVPNLKKANNLKSDLVRIGQILTIPSS